MSWLSELLNKKAPPSVQYATESELRALDAKLATFATRSELDAFKAQSNARMDKLEAATTAPTTSSMISERYGSADVGNYFVQNDVWNDQAGVQVLTVKDNGFLVTSTTHNLPPNGPPAAYPSIVYGVHYTRQSPNNPLPKKVKSVNSAITVDYTTATDSIYDCAYDIWLDDTAKLDGQNDTEIMIWLNHADGVQPVGSKQNFAASPISDQFDLWYGNIGWDVYSYVAKSPMTSFSGDLAQFIPDNKVTTKYLTSVQFGFEIWSKGAGLAVNSFSVNIA